MLVARMLPFCRSTLFRRAFSPPSIAQIGRLPPPRILQFSGPGDVPHDYTWNMTSRRWSRAPVSETNSAGCTSQEPCVRLHWKVADSSDKALLSSMEQATVVMASGWVHRGGATGELIRRTRAMQFDEAHTLFVRECEPHFLKDWLDHSCWRFPSLQRLFLMNSSRNAAATTLSAVEIPHTVRVFTTSSVEHCHWLSRVRFIPLERASRLYRQCFTHAEERTIVRVTLRPILRGDDKYWYF